MVKSEVIMEENIYNECEIMNFETCRHRKEVDIMGIKKRSLFCDIDDMECGIMCKVFGY